MLILNDDLTWWSLLYGVTSRTFTHIFIMSQQIMIIYLPLRHNYFVQATIYPEITLDIVLFFFLTWGNPHPIHSITSISHYKIRWIMRAVSYITAYTLHFSPLLIYISYNIKRTIFRKNVYKKYNRAVIITSFYITPCVKRRLLKKKKKKYWPSLQKIENLGDVC